MSGERRQRVLTDEDVQTLVLAMQSSHPHCNVGLTPDEVSILKRLLKAWNKGTSIVGSMILIAIVGAVITIFSKGFWDWLKLGGKP